MSNEELVSRIVNSVRSLTKDDHVSRRYILSIARNKAKFLIAQKLRDKTLFREDSLFKTINCFEMKEISTIDCGVVEFKRCDSLMRSKEKLPDLIYSLYGSSIVNVSTLDGSEVLYPITPNKYSNLKKRKGHDTGNAKYYYVKDGYLYLPDSHYKMLDVVLITMETEKADELSTCTDSDCCKSTWEFDFNCPDKLIEAVIQDTLGEVLNTKNIPVDENPNLDSNIKSKTVI